MKKLKKLKRKKTIKLNKIYQGDVKKVLAKFPSNIVDCVCTSPPYFNLRDYQTGEWIGGNDPKCKHIKNQAFSSKTTIQKNQKKVNKGRELYYNHKCPKCGAVKKDLQIGAEKTPEEFVETMVKIFRQIKRMLKDTGTVWLNLGSSYCSTPVSSMMELKDNLTEKEIAYVLRELSYGIDDKLPKD